MLSKPVLIKASSPKRGGYMTVNESTLPAELDVVHLPVHRGRCACGFAWIQRGFGQLHVSTRNSFACQLMETMF